MVKIVVQANNRITHAAMVLARFLFHFIDEVTKAKSTMIIGAAYSMKRLDLSVSNRKIVERIKKNNFERFFHNACLSIPKTDMVYVKSNIPPAKRRVITDGKGSHSLPDTPCKKGKRK